jgi:hypothetical protein
MPRNINDRRRPQGNLAPRKATLRAEFINEFAHAALTLPEWNADRPFNPPRHELPQTQQRDIHPPHWILIQIDRSSVWFRWHRFSASPL